jgi:hypothetical protein
MLLSLTPAWFVNSLVCNNSPYAGPQTPLFLHAHGTTAWMQVDTGSQSRQTSRINPRS